MKIDLSLIPTTFDALHAALAAAVVGLLLLQVLLLTVAVVAIFRKWTPAEATREPVRPSEPMTTLRGADRPELAVARPVAVTAETTMLRESTPDAALQLLGLLQKEARFVDFVQENVSGYSDTDIGAAARVVHEGCSKVLRQHFELEPVRHEAEGNRITLPKGFDASAVRLTGNIVGDAPFTGTLVHRGWKVKNIKLPKITEGHDVRIVAAAEVEL